MHPSSGSTRGGGTKGPCPPPPPGQPEIFFWGGATRAPPPPPPVGKKKIFFGGGGGLIFIDLTVQKSWTWFLSSVIYGLPFSKYNIVYTTRKSLLKMTSGPENSIKINRCRILHCFKLSQNAPLGNLFFNVISSSNCQNIASNSVRMRRLASLISKFSQHFQKKWEWGRSPTRPFYYFE